jgi:protein-L-isoaspartate(D-aspartate) O-methyltransferase
MNIDYKKERETMVEQHLAARGITDQNVLDAFLEVPREEFVPDKYKEIAYVDRPLPIDNGATISQPYTVALMCQIISVDKDSKVLDIGAGSGYESAILSLICKEVIAMERIKELADSARKRLKSLGYDNVKVIHGDGSEGYKKKAPYDAIKVAATTEQITDAWRDQLKVGGKLVYPELLNDVQKLVEATKTQDGFTLTTHGYVTFVPLIKGTE